VKRSIERSVALIEVDDPDGVHLNADEVVVWIGKNGSDLSEDEKSASSANLKDESEVGSNERRSAPGDLKHGTKEMMTARGREDAIDVADDLRSVSNWIAGEHDAVERVILETGAKNGFIEGSVDGDETADAGESETESELDGGEAFDKDD
jgi:hypothetical protein